MSKGKNTFTSFADAAAAIKGMVDPPIAKAKAGRPIEEKAAEVRRSDFADVEAAMVAKAEREHPPRLAASARRVFEVHKDGRHGKKLVEAGTPSPEQVQADVAAHRKAQARKSALLAAEEARASFLARAAKQAGEAQTTSTPSLPAQAGGYKLRGNTQSKSNVPSSGRNVAPQSATAAGSATAPTMGGLLAAVRQVFANAPPAIEKRAQAVQRATRGPVEAAISRGAALFTSRPEHDDTGFIVGCDFGTSSTKIVVRQPYSSGDPTARPAPSALQSNRHPYLWQTVLWFDPGTGVFSLLPGKGTIALEGFKAGILAGEGGKRVVADLPVTRNQAAAAFLALQLSHCLGWYDLTRPLGDQGGNHFLAINIGIPVAAQDDEQTCRDFRHVVSAARNLIGEANCLTHDRVRSAYQASSHELPDGFDLVPELAAAISGYANEPYARNGSHMLIDVGASTLDIVAFILVDRQRVSALAAEVELLGAAALDAARQAGFTDPPFRSACIGQFDSVFNFARRTDVAPLNFDQALRRNPVQLIAVGGGCKTAVHKDMIARVQPCLGDLKILSPQPPLRLSAGACDASRLLLAYGLTADIPEQLELRRPSDIPRIAPPRSTSITFISKDQM